jgi:hypothetical protein
MLPQAGIAIGLADLVRQQFRPWGEGASFLMLGTILVGQMIGPIVFRVALVRAGEAGQRAEEDPAAVETPPTPATEGAPP